MRPERSYDERFSEMLQAAPVCRKVSDDRGLAGLQDLLAAVPVPSEAKSDLIGRMTEPHRRYHGLAHLDLLWQRHTSFRDGAGLDRAFDRRIACAIAFHDSICDFGAKDNEIRSAELWLSVSNNGALSETERAWVADTIVATADHGAARLDLSDAEARAQQWVLDLDLTPLGEVPEVFDRNVGLLRAEAHSLSDDQWAASLKRSWEHFAGLQPLYKSAAIARAFAEPARRNLERRLLRLRMMRSASSSSCEADAARRE